MTTPPPAPPTRRSRRLWRWLRRIVIAAVVLVLVARIALPFVLPSILDSIAGGFGLTARYESLDLSILGGEVRLRRLQVFDRGDADDAGAVPYLDLEYANVDVDILTLLSGPLHVHRVELDGADLRVERLADGTIPLFAHFAADPHAGPTEPPPAAAPPTDPPAPLDLASPVRVDALRVQHVRLNLVDRRASPPTDDHIELNVRISDVGDPTRDARIQMSVVGPGLVDRLAVEGAVCAVDGGHEAELELEVAGAHPHAAAAWLAELGIAPAARHIDASASVTARVVPSPDTPDSIDASATIAGVHVHADGHEELAIDAIELEVQGTGRAGTRVPTIDIRGVRGRAAQLADGSLAVGGIELRAVPTRPEPTPPAPAQTAAAPPSPRGTATAPFALDRLQIADVALAFEDRGTAPGTILELAVDDLTLIDLVADPARPDATATLTVRARAPGVAEAVSIDARIVPFAIRRSARADLRAEQITLARLTPLLERAGVVPSLENGTLTVRVDASARADADNVLRVDAAVESLALTDGERSLVQIERVAMDGVRIDAARDATTIGEVTIQGVDVPVRRDAADTIHVAGLELRSAPAAAPPGPGGAAARAQPPDGSPSRFELVALRLRESTLRFVDESVTPTVETATSAFEADVENLVLGGATDATESPAATLRVRVRVPGIAEELGLRGTIRSRPGPLDLTAQLQIAGDRLAAGNLASYLDALGIESTLTAGRLRAAVDAHALATGDGGVRATANLTELTFQDGDAEPFLSVEAVTVDALTLGEDGVQIGAVAVVNPRLRAERAADGSLLALGMRFRPPAPAAAPAPTAPARQPEAPATAATRDSALSIARFELTGGQLGWRDGAVTTAVECELDLEARVTDLGIGTGIERPAEVEVTLRAHGAVEEAKITGTLTLDPAGLRAELRLDARGLRAGPFAGYVPDGTTVTLQDGRLTARVAARVNAVEAGGIGLEVALTELDYRDGERALLTAGPVRFAASRLDPDGGVVAIDELTVQGVQLDASRNTAGATELLGLELATPSSSASPAGPATLDPTAATVPSGPPTASPEWPRITIQRLDVGVARIRFEDASSDEPATPIDGRLRLYADQPLVLLDDDSEALEPLRLKVDGAIDPLVDSIALELEASPWSATARVDAQLQVTGIRGTAIPQVLPSLAERIDGSQLADGSLVGKLVANLTIPRRSGRDLDLSRGIGVELNVDALEFRATPDGEVLAGIDAVFVEAPRVIPGATIRIARFEVDGIRGRVRRTSSGVEALGLTFKPATESETATPAEPVLPAESAAPPPPDPEDPAPREIRIDQLGIHGIGFEYRDERAEPPTVIPLSGLDVEVYGLSSLATTHSRPMRFSVSVTGGDVELPKVIPAGSIVSGILGSALQVVTGGADEVELEQRPFLDELAIQGQLTLFPKPEGRVRGSIAGLELTAFRSIAKEGGVEIGDGVLDAGTNLSFLGDDGVRVDARLAFDRLAVDVPPGGPISSFLKLPAPLNTVLFALRDDRGQIAIPLQFELAEAGIGTGQITRQALRALTSAIADAVASAPFRVTGFVTGTLGLGSLFGGSATPIEEQAAAVTFPPAVTGLLRSDRERLLSVVEILQDDDDVGVVLEHAFGPEDWERAAVLANPTPAQTRELVTRLRQNRGELTRQRTERGADTRALIATGRDTEAQAAVRQLQALDRELGETELALDRALELLRPGAELRADRRTRDMALDIGNRRLETVRRVLVELGGAGLAERIEVRRARPGARIETDGTVVAQPRRRKQG